MSLMLYALAEHGCLPGDLLEINTAKPQDVQILSLTEGDAVVATLESLEGKTSEQYLEYYNFITSLYRYGTMIPFRFGTIFGNRVELEQALAAKSSEIQQCFVEIDSCVEFCLTMMNIKPVFENNETGADSKEKSGRQFLLARKKHYTGIQRKKESINTMAAPVQHHFTGCFKKSLVNVKNSGGKTTLAGSSAETGQDLEIHFLVPAGRQVQFLQAFDNHYRDDNRVKLSGPWPPFIFVNHYINMDVQSS